MLRSGNGPRSCVAAAAALVLAAVLCAAVPAQPAAAQGGSEATKVVTAKARCSARVDIAVGSEAVVKVSGASVRLRGEVAGGKVSVTPKGKRSVLVSGAEPGRETVSVGLSLPGGRRGTLSLDVLVRRTPAPSISELTWDGKTLSQGLCAVFRYEEGGRAELGCGAVLPGGARVEWATSDESVASVSPEGVLEMRRPGTTVVAAQLLSPDGELLSVSWVSANLVDPADPVFGWVVR